ncbi:hypothetical protein AB0M46_46860 [Dactylosporangium sp. NPDC051485]|uniref:hypothetical protein n=1 Tax=Dactylosporangium sp. NPDC051485 TaxID=3154846 RepID=UPI00341C9470
MTLKPGDMLLMECERTSVRVSRIIRSWVMVRWPWREIDPESRTRWDGTVAIPCDPTRIEWFHTPWRLDPHVGLSVGDTCSLFIPPTRVIVRGVHQFDPPMAMGYLPRANYAVEMVEVAHQDNENVGFVMYFDFAEPIRITPVGG